MSRALNETGRVGPATRDRVLTAAHRLGYDQVETDVRVSADERFVLAHDPDLGEWKGLGLAVQAYQRRATDVIRFLSAMAGEVGRRIPVRLVKGSHIVTRKLYAHDRCYFLQNADGRPIFAIPYETDYTLIGTTDLDYEGDPGHVAITGAEIAYLCAAVNAYFARPIGPVRRSPTGGLEQPSQVGEPELVAWHELDTGFAGRQEITPDQSRRMGSANKLLAEVDGQPMVVHAVDTALSAQATSVTVVLGHQAVVGAGLSFGITDLRIPGRKHEIIAASQTKVDRVEKAFHAGAITDREHRRLHTAVA